MAFTRRTCWMALVLTALVALAGCADEDDGGILPDAEAPVITSGPTVAELTTGAARIDWTTNETSNSTVRYGPDTTLAYVAADPELVTAHSVWLLNGLVPDSTVLYRVESTDLSRNTAISAIDTLVPPHAVLAFDPDTSSVAVGDAFSVDLAVAAVTDLFGAAVTVHFDTSLVRCDSVVPGAFLGGAGDVLVELAHVDSAAGTASIGITRVQPADGRSGDGTLAIFHFTALGAGGDTLRVDEEDLALQDPDGEVMVNFEGLQRRDGWVQVSTP